MRRRRAEWARGAIGWSGYRRSPTPRSLTSRSRSSWTRSWRASATIDDVDHAEILYISRELGRRMRGRIWVTSEEGEGSTFYLELPFVDPQEVAA